MGGSTLTSAPFLTGVVVVMDLGAVGAIGDTEVGGVTEGGFLSFFGCLFGGGRRGDSPPDGCVCGEYRSRTW